MGRVVHQILIFSVFLFFYTDNFASSQPSFDSRYSRINVQSGSEFFVNTPISNFNGTLKINPGGIVSGENITFSEGLFEYLGNELLMTAILDPMNLIFLTGDHLIRSAPGKVLQAINVSGSNNRIEGAPVFTQNVTLLDSSSSVTLALQSEVSQNIVLNDSIVRLENDLSFVDAKFFSGSGIIDGNGYRVKTGSSLFSATDALFWDDGSNIEIRTDRMDLLATYTFSGTTSINGHGGVLELGAGGKIVIDYGSTLDLTDLTLKGVDDGDIIFLGDDSQILMSGVNVELTSDITTTIGGIFVKGPSTWIVKDHTWTFDNLASVTVDGVTVWKDNAGEESAGDVVFGSPEENFYTSISSGTIKGVFACSDFDFGDIVDRVEDLEDCCASATTRIEDLEDCCEELKTSTGELQNQIDNFEDCCEELKTSTGELQDQIDNFEDCCEELKTSTGELQDQIDNFEDCCEELKTSTGELQDQIDNFEDCCEELKTSTGELQNQIDNFEDCCEELKTSTGELQDQIDNFEDCCEELKTSTGELQNQIDNFEDCCEELKTSTGELQDQIDNFEDCCEELKTSTGELQNQIDNFEDCCEELKTSTGELQNQIDNFEDCCEELKTSTGELQDQIDNFEDCCEELKTSTGELEVRIEVLEDYCESITAIIETLEDCCDTATTLIETLEDCCDTATTLIERLEDCCETVTTQIEHLEICCEDVEKRLDKLEACCPKCVIHITEDTFFDPVISPEMLPTVSGAVVFRFEPCWGWSCTDTVVECVPCIGIPKLIFDKTYLDFGGPDEGKVLLPNGSRMIFQGEGIVEVRDGIEFTSEGSFLPICDWPYVIIEERAMMKPALNADVFFTGWLNVNVRDFGMLWLDQTSHVIFGAGLSEFFAIFHQINLDVDGVGSVIVDDPGARVTFQQAIFNATFSRSSLLSILDGRVEINSNDGIYMPGTFSSLMFSKGGNLEIRRGIPGQSCGLLRLSPNLDNQLLNFDNRTGVIDGGGHKTFGKGNMQFIADDLTGGSGIGLPLQGLIDTTIRVQKNFYQATDTIVEQFLELGLVLKSGEAGVSPSDLDIIVQLGSEGDQFAAIDPRRTGSVLELQEGDHDVAYESPSEVPGVGAFPIIGLDSEGDFFEIDENGVRNTIT